MSRLFNGTCAHCACFGPRRARVLLTGADSPVVLCPDCRSQMRGGYRVPPRSEPPTEPPEPDDTRNV